MEIITIPAKFGSTRKAYKLQDNESVLTNFKAGDEVIPAEIFEQPGTVRFFFLKKHEPGEKGYIEGGYDCRDNTGAIRSFYLDALIKKSTLVEVSIERPTQRKRGRPRISPEVLKTDKPKGKRGRPRKNPEEKMVKAEYVPTGRKRGRPKKDPNSVTKVYIPTGRKRGRPKKESI
jgi:hypothetical protein